MNEDQINCKVLKRIFQLRFGTPEGIDKQLKQLSIQAEELQMRSIPLTLVRDYKFNNKQVYYIFKRPGRKTNTFGCKICNHSFEDARFLYCSLECLVESISGKISQVQANTTSIKNEIEKSASINLTSDTSLKIHTNVKCVIEEGKPLPPLVWNGQIKCLQKRKSRRNFSKLLDSIKNLSNDSNGELDSTSTSSSNSELDSTNISPTDNSNQPNLIRNRRNRRKQSTPTRSPSQ